MGGVGSQGRPHEEITTHTTAGVGLGQVRRIGVPMEDHVTGGVLEDGVGVCCGVV
jgi:hypothetical protein